MILFDANVLIYAVDADSSHHEAARKRLVEAISSGDEVGLAWVVILAFLRVTTHPAVMRRPLTTEAALEYVDDWLAQPNVRAVAPGEHHWAIVKTLLAATGSAGNLTSDAHLAALAIEHGAVLCSTDNDFKRFPGVRHSNPLVS